MGFRVEGAEFIPEGSYTSGEATSHLGFGVPKNISLPKNFNLKVRAKIWPRPSYMCHVRSTVVLCRMDATPDLAGLTNYSGRGVPASEEEAVVRVLEDLPNLQNFVLRWHVMSWCCYVGVNTVPDDSTNSALR